MEDEFELSAHAQDSHGTLELYPVYVPGEASVEDLDDRLEFNQITSCCCDVCFWSHGPYPRL